VHQTSERRFHLPIRIEPKARETVAAFRLWYTVDKGKTWKLHQEVKINERSDFAFAAPEEGLYAFCLQTVQRDGTYVPATTRDLRPELWVQVGPRVRRPLL
jgi:hypothetical protein